MLVHQQGHQVGSRLPSSSQGHHNPTAPAARLPIVPAPCNVPRPALTPAACWGRGGAPCGRNGRLHTCAQGREQAGHHGTVGGRQWQQWSGSFSAIWGSLRCVQRSGVATGSTERWRHACHGKAERHGAQPAHLPSTALTSAGMRSSARPPTHSSDVGNSSMVAGMRRAWARGREATAHYAAAAAAAAAASDATGSACRL